MVQAWTFGVLGPLKLGPPDAGDLLTAPKLRSLLTLLLLDTEPVPPARVRAALDEHDRWCADAGPMHVAVHRLRRWLRQHGEHRLDLEPNGYRLAVTADRVDAGRFRRLVVESQEHKDLEARADRLVAALSLWRGPVAADAPDTVRRQAAARQLERLHRQAIVDLADACLATGQAYRALPLVERAAEAAPYDEQTQSLFALSLAGCGLQAEALDVIERTRRTLVADLGIDPSSHLSEARCRILRHDVVRRVTGRPARRESRR
jgi:DNA-binding SARP family transcriptional activator